MKTIKLLSIMAAVAIIFNSCSKGDTGAAGPTGPAGANGNANVTTGQVSITASNWGWTGTSYTCTINSSNITSSLISSGGAVEVYISNDGGAVWVALSYTYINPSISSPNAFMSYGFGSGQVILIWTWNNDAEDGDPCTTYGSSLLVNVIAVPASIVVSHPNTNWSNASEVAEIPEVKAVLNNQEKNKDNLQAVL